MRRQPSKEGPPRPVRGSRDVVRAYRLGIGGALLILVVLAIGGYVGGWAWTGFGGSTVWDWLNLLILPVVLGVLPLWHRTHRSRRTHWRVAWVLVGVSFVVLVIGGYALGWSWTGFGGNTVWDWLKLLLVPFVLPVVLTHLAAHPPHEQAAAQPPGE